ncbi:MAG: CvpA family protein [Clostridia bacterium]|nr:CvpA family protein [Clostridia bacterium]
MSTVSLGINIAALALTVLGILLGLKRGLVHSVLRLAAAVGAALVSLLGARMLRDYAATFIQGFLDGFLKDNATVQELITASPTAKELITSLPGALAAPLVFFALFLILNLVFYGIYKILKKLTAFTKEAAKKTVFGKLQIGRILGASVSLVASFLIVICILAPFSGYLSLADDVVKELEKVELDEDMNQTIASVDKNVITPLTDNTALTVSGTLLNSIVFETVTSYEMNGSTVVWSEEIAYLANTYTTVKPLIDAEFDLSRFTKTEADAIRAFAAHFNDSELVPHIIAELLPAMATKWNNGETFCGIENPAAATPEMLHPLMTSLFEVLETTTYETLPGDLTTMAELVASLAESGTFAMLGGNVTAKDIIMTLSQPGLVSGLIDTLYANERMQLLVADIANIGFEAIGDSLEIPSDDEAVRASLSVELNNAVKEAEKIESYDDRVSALSDDINNLFTKYGMESDASTAQLYAECIVGIGPITSANPESVVVDYFDIISAALGEELASMATVRPLSSATESPINAKVKEIIAAYLATNGTEGIQKSLALSNQINGKEDLKHAVVTLEKVRLSADDMINMSPEALAVQSKSLEKIVTVLADVIEVKDDGSFNVDVTKLDTDALAESLADLGSTAKDENGEAVNNLANAMTGVVKYSLYKVGIDAGAANNLVDHMTEPTPEGEEKKNPISSAVAVLDIVQNSKESTPEDMKAHVTELIKNLDPTTAKVLSDCISVNLINSFAPNAMEPARTNALIVVIKDMIANFGEAADELSEEQLDAETAYLQTIFELAVNASTDTDAVLFKSATYPASKLDMTAAEFLASIEHSTVIAETFTEEKENLKLAVNNTMAAPDKAELLAAIQQDANLSDDLKATLVYVFCLEASAE